MAVFRYVAIIKKGGAIMKKSSLFSVCLVAVLVFSMGIATVGAKTIKVGIVDKHTGGIIGVV